jgi:hypothetical protein
MSRYCGFGAAAAASVASTAEGIMHITNPSSSTMSKQEIYEWSLGPGAAAEDSNYSVAMVRVTGVGTYTSVTPSPTESGAPASVAICGRAQTAASNTKGVTLGDWGFNQRGGYRWVAVPGGELICPATFSAGILLLYTVVQGTAINRCSIWFIE